jgi:hypothetical protein
VLILKGLMLRQDCAKWLSSGCPYPFPVSAAKSGIRMG